MTRSRQINGKNDKNTKENYEVYSRSSNITLSAEVINNKGESGGIVMGDDIDFPAQARMDQLNIIDCVITFDKCRDYMDLTKEERNGDVEANTEKIYGFDRYQEEFKNLYGFTWNSVSSESVNKNPINEKNSKFKLEDLEREYDIIPIGRKRKKYYTPWLSMYKGQKIRLRLSMQWKNKPLEIKWDIQRFQKQGQNINNDSLEINKLLLPNNILIKKGGQEIEIECIDDFEENLDIRILADNELAGRLLLVPNKVRKLKVTWCIVELSGPHKRTGNNIDKNKLESKLTKQQIERFVKYLGLSQALIDVEVTDSYKYLELFSKTKPYDNSSNYSWKDFTTVKNFTYNGEEGVINTALLMQTLKNEYEANWRDDDNNIVIFLINMKSPKTDKNLEEKKIEQRPGENTLGSAFALGSKYLVLYDGFINNTKVVVHEILHCLGLLHTFDVKGKHVFKAKETDNFMDYVPSGSIGDRRKSLWKWQWEIIWETLDKIQNE